MAHGNGGDGALLRGRERRREGGAASLEHAEGHGDDRAARIQLRAARKLHGHTAWLPAHMLHWAGEAQREPVGHEGEQAVVAVEDVKVSIAVAGSGLLT